MRPCRSTPEAAPDATKRSGGQYYRPSVDIVERTDELTLLAEMPGVKPGEIDIDFKDGLLSITGRVEQRQGEDTHYLLQEFGVGDYYRTFQISEHIDTGRITAEFHNGVLMLHLPKVETLKPRKIAVQVG